MKRDAGNDDRPSDFCFGTKQLLGANLRRALLWLQCNVAPHHLCNQSGSIARTRDRDVFERYQWHTRPGPANSNQFSHQMEIPDLNQHLYWY